MQTDGYNDNNNIYFIFVIYQYQLHHFRYVLFFSIQSLKQLTLVNTEGDLASAQGCIPHETMPCKTSSSFSFGQTKGPPESPCKTFYYCLTLESSKYKNNSLYSFQQFIINKFLYSLRYKNLDPGLQHKPPHHTKGPIPYKALRMCLVQLQECLLPAIRLAYGVVHHYLFSPSRYFYKVFQLKYCKISSCKFIGLAVTKFV